MADAIPIVIVRNGREKSAHHLNRGDQIAFREWDVKRGTYVFWVVTPGVPASSEVVQADVWDCDYRGHRFVPGNQCCMECGATWAP